MIFYGKPPRKSPLRTGPRLRPHRNKLEHDDRRYHFGAEACVCCIFQTLFCWICHPSRYSNSRTYCQPAANQVR